MTSVKERIAALQNSQRNEKSSSVPQSPITRKNVNHNFQSIQSRIEMSYQEEQESQQPIAKSNKPTPSRTKVSSLAQNMKGLDMQAMLSGHRIGEKTPWKKDTNSTETGGIQNDVVGENEIMKTQHLKRAVIEHGRRRPRTIPNSLQGIKFSTE